MKTDLKNCGARLCATLVLAMGAVLAGCSGGSTSINETAQSKQFAPVQRSSVNPYQGVVQELYIGYFGRPADPAGLANFESALAASGAPSTVSGLSSAYATNSTVRTLIDAFGTSKESKTLFGSGTTTQFVQAVFQNVIGRQPLQAGLDFWVSAIDSGSLSQGDAALSIMAGALANQTAQGLIDAQLVNNRLAVATYFTSQVSAQNDTGYYGGAKAAGTARTMLNGVDSTTDTTAYQTDVATAISTIVSESNVPQVTTLAGNIARSGWDNGTGTAATFYNPQGLAVDSSGNVYVADTNNDLIREISPGGVVTTFMGQNGNASGGCDSGGPLSSALVNSPQSVAIDAAGDIYITAPCYDVLQILAGTGTMNALNLTNGDGNVGKGYVAVGGPGGFIYYTTIEGTSSGNALIWKTNADGVNLVLAGGDSGGNCQTEPCSFDGTGTVAAFANPLGIAVDLSGNVYVADQATSMIRKISPQGVVTTLAGGGGCIPSQATGCSIDGTGSAASFNGPTGIAVDASGNVYVADTQNHAIRVVSPAGVVTTLAGTPGTAGSMNGAASAASFNYPTGIAVDANGNVYVGDSMNNLVRKISP